MKWAPDGRHIAFTAPVPATPAQREAQHPDAPRVLDAEIRHVRLWLVPVGDDGSSRGPARPLSSEQMSIRTDVDFGSPFDWSPDGSALVFSHSSNPDWWNNWPTTGVSVVELASDKTRSIVTKGAMAPAYAPDGQWIAYLAAAASHAVHNLDVVVVNSVTGERRTLAATFDRHPLIVGWSGDASHVFVSETRGTVTRLSSLPTDGTRPRDLDAGDAARDCDGTGGVSRRRTRRDGAEAPDGFRPEAGGVAGAVSALAAAVNE